MHLDNYNVKVPIISPDEWEAMPQDQQDRVQELKRKLKQYEGMMKTFVTRYTGKKVNHETLSNHLENNK